MTLWISPVMQASAENLRSQFVRGTPFPHVVVPHFLNQERADALRAALEKEPFSHKESDLFSLNQTVDFSSSTNPLLKEFYLFAASKEFATVMRSLTGINVTPGALDLAGSLYKSGDYLLCHDDQVEDRRLAYILYLSKGFSEKDGARFVLFNNVNGKPTDVAHRYVPVWNSLLVFEVSPVSFHMVEENFSSKDRYAIGGWLH